MTAKSAAQRRKPDHAALLQTKLEPRKVFSDAKNEAGSHKECLEAQQLSTPSFQCGVVGFMVSAGKPWLDASHDGVVTDVKSSAQKGLLEIKCPYTAWNSMRASKYAATKSSC